MKVKEKAGRVAELCYLQAKKGRMFLSFSKKGQQRGFNSIYLGNIYTWLQPVSYFSALWS